MKFLFCFITLVCLKQTTFADPTTALPSACSTADQCATPAFRTSLNIQYGRGTIHAYKGQIDTVSGLDSFVVNILGDRIHSCISFKDLMVYRDQAMIFSANGQLGEPIFYLISLSGHYKISCYWQSPALIYEMYTWEFDLILKPAEVDTSKHETALPVVMELNPEFLLYPNPAENTISFLNESKQIKTAAICNLTGQKIAFFEVNNIKADIPINDLSPGIYFLQVATVSEKLIIKKFIKQ